MSESTTVERQLKEGIEAHNDGKFGKALRIFRLARFRGNPIAQFNLAVMYENGHRVKQNNTQAVRLYRLAADQGYADAQFQMGWRFWEGERVEQRNTEGLRWYRLAADQSHAAAQFNSGLIYEKELGVRKKFCSSSSVVSFVCRSKCIGGPSEIDRSLF
jgi:uncharacterized protein